MKIIFDHNVPKRLRRFLIGHDIRTALEMSWAELENGELLNEAESAGFDLMISGDKNLAYQQNLDKRKLALIILSTNNWNLIKKNTELVTAAVNLATPGSYKAVTVDDFNKSSL